MRLSSLALFLAACSTADDERSTPVFLDGSDDERALAEEIAGEELARRAPEWGVDPAELRVTRVKIDELLSAHTKVQQTVRGVPVFGGEAIVHLDPWGEVQDLTDAILRDVVVDVSPTLDAEDAVEIAVDDVGGWERTSREPVAELWVLRHGGADHLTWRIDVEQLDGSNSPARPIVFVDAHDGAIVWSYDNFQTSGGTAYYAGSVSINSYLSGSTYYLEDSTRDIGTYSMGNTTTSAYYVTDSDDVWDGDPVAVQAHFDAATVWDYYYNTYGRNNIDGVGGPGYISSLTGSGTVVSSFVHYGTNYVNAGWSGYMVYGDGDGYWSGPLTTTDITAHEMTHGVTESESNLTYSGESGGLNEALSDIFGAMVERYSDGNVTSTNTWYIGEDAWTPSTSGDALRYMHNPKLDGASDDYYSSSVGTHDVHYSSGIANLAFYLLSQGGAHPRLGGTSMTGIGPDAAAAIWYRAATTYFTSSTNFSGARTHTLSAAADLYGTSSAEYTAVGNSWTLVGVGGTTTPSCSTYTYTGTGSLSSTGSSGYQPSSSGYSKTTSSTHSGYLSGPSTANFNLYLQKYNSKSKKWSSVASGTTSTSTETVSYSGGSGTYRWLVYSSSGSGSYTLCYSY